MNSRIPNVDHVAETFHCTYCNTEVEEDASALLKRDPQTLLAKFNEQMEPVFVLLRETEDIVLPYELLEPQPTEIPELSERYNRNLQTSDQQTPPPPPKLLSCKTFEILNCSPLSTQFCFVGCLMKKPAISKAF